MGELRFLVTMGILITALVNVPFSIKFDKYPIVLFISGIVVFIAIAFLFGLLEQAAKKVLHAIKLDTSIGEFTKTKLQKNFEKTFLSF